MRDVQQSSANSPVSTSQAGSVQREASDSVRGAVRGMSFDEGAAALAPVQRKAVQRAPGSAIGAAAQGAVSGASSGAAAATSGAQASAAGAGGAAGGAAAKSPYGGDSGTATISAGAIQLNAGAVSAPGVLTVDTLVAKTVVGANYTPGAGNLM